MPATLAAGAVTDGYRRRLLELRDSTALAAAALLADINLDQGPAGVSRDLDDWQRQASILTTAAGTQAARWTVSYLSSYLVASGARPSTVRIPTADPNPSRLVAVRAALLSRLGQRAGREVAFRSASATAERTVRETVASSAIETLAEGVRLEPQIVGWRRVTSTSCCSRCAVLAGKTFGDNDSFDRHPVCRCSHEPIVLGRAEAFQRQSPTVVAP